MAPILGEYLQRVSYFICSNFSLCCICYCKITCVFVLVYLWSFNLPLLPVVRILFLKFSSMSVSACCKWTVRLLVERVTVLHPIQLHESNLEKFRKTNTSKLKKKKEGKLTKSLGRQKKKRKEKIKDKHVKVTLRVILSKPNGGNLTFYMILSKELLLLLSRQQNKQQGCGRNLGGSGDSCGDRSVGLLPRSILYPILWWDSHNVLGSHHNVWQWRSMGTMWWRSKGIE